MLSVEGKNPMKRRLLALATLFLAAQAALAGTEGIHIGSGSAQPFDWVCKDGAGFVWDITQHGQVKDGTNDVYDVGMTLAVNGRNWSQKAPGRISRDRREVEIGPWSYGSLKVWRRIYVDGRTGYCRWIDIFENTSTSQQSFTLRYHTNIGGRVAHTFTTTGKTDLAEEDWGIVTAETDGRSSRPALAHVFATRDAKLKPRFQWTRNNDNLYYHVKINVPAGQAVALCFFEAQRRPYSEAKNFIRAFRPESELRKVPPALRRIILNMSYVAAVLGTLELPRNEQHDVAIKRNGDELLGEMRNANYVLEDTFCGRLELPADRVIGLSVSDGRSGHVRLGLTDGQVLAGKLLSWPIDFRTTDGKDMSLSAGDIRTVAYRLSEERPHEIAVDAPMVALRSGHRLLYVDGEFSCKFRTAYGDVELDGDELLSLHFDTPEGGLHRAVFRNGSVLSGMVLAEQIKLPLNLQKTIAVPRQAIGTISFPAGQDEAGPLATLKLSNEDVLVGRIAEESLSVRTAKETVTVAADEIAGLAAAGDLPPSSVSITRHDGTKVSGKLAVQTIRFHIDPGPVVPVFIGHVVEITCPKGSHSRAPATKPAGRP